MKTVFKNPWVRFIGLLILIVIGVRVLHAIRGVLIPFSLALVVAYIFDPVVDWMEQRRIGWFKPSRGFCVCLLVCVAAAVVVAFALFAIPNAVQSLEELITAKNMDRVVQILPKNVREVVEELRGAEGPAERQLIIHRLLGDLLASEGAAGAVGKGARAVAVSAFAALMWVFNFFLFFVVTVYLLIDIDRVRDRVRDVLPLAHKDEILRIAGRLDTDLKAFFRGQCVVVMCLSIIFTVGLLIVGCPFWYLVGVAGGIGAFIPYFALASGMVPGMILAAAQYGNLGRPLAVAVVFGIGLTIDNIFITPRIIGKRVGMHPVVVILSILIFGTLFGFLGVIFAVPIAAVVKVFAAELFDRYRRSELYTGTEEGDG